MQLNLITPFNTLSYGYTGSFIYEELNKLIDVKPFCLGQFTAERRFEYIKTVCDSVKLTYHHNAPCLKIWHQHDMTGFTGKGPSIGFPIFELNKFNDLEKHNLEYPDHLFVTSKWAKNIILENVDRKEETVHIAPLGVDAGIFQESSFRNDGKTRFINFGKWEVRKGHDILCEAFNRAFTVDDDVELVLFTTNMFLKPHQHKEWCDFYINSELGSKIKIGKRLENQEQVYNVMKDMDCGVFPARAEGWNLELLEMMSCGKPVITTNVTAHTEFCTTENSMLIELEDMELAFDGQFFNGQGDWYCIDDAHIDQIAEYMKTVHKLKQENNLQQNTAGIETAKKFTWSNSAQTIVQLLKEITE